MSGHRFVKSVGLLCFAALLAAVLLSCSGTGANKPYDEFGKQPWHTRVDSMDAGLDLRLSSTDKDVNEYMTNLRRFGNTDIDSCLLGFHRDRLYSVSVTFHGDEAYAAMKRYIGRRFHTAPAQADTFGDFISVVYRWPDPNTTLILGYKGSTREGGYFLFDAETQEYILRNR